MPRQQQPRPHALIRVRRQLLRPLQSRDQLLRVTSGSTRPLAGSRPQLKNRQVFFRRSRPPFLRRNHLRSFSPRCNHKRYLNRSRPFLSQCHRHFFSPKRRHFFGRNRQAVLRPNFRLSRPRSRPPDVDLNHPPRLGSPKSKSFSSRQLDTFGLNLQPISDPNRQPIFGHNRPRSFAHSRLRFVIPTRQDSSSRKPQSSLSSRSVKMPSPTRHRQSQLSQPPKKQTLVQRLLSPATRPFSR